MPRRRSPFDRLFADLAKALAELRVDWYLFGAQAALLYGATRVTADVDVTVRLAGREKDRSDVREMLATHPIDLAKVRESLSLLEEALGQSDLLPLLEQLAHGD